MRNCLAILAETHTGVSARLASSNFLGQGTLNLLLTGQHLPHAVALWKHLQSSREILGAITMGSSQFAVESSLHSFEMMLLMRILLPPSQLLVHEDQELQSFQSWKGPELLRIG